MTKPIIFVTGKDPLEGVGGGTVYVRGHARAALRAGYEPHIFCVTSRDEVVATDFGFVHRVLTPFRPIKSLSVAPNEYSSRFVRHWLNALAFTPLMVGFHKPALVESIAKFLRVRKGPHLIHGFYTWGCVGLDLRRRLPDQRVVVINSVYTTAEHEISAKHRGLSHDAEWMRRLLYRIELGWVRLSVTRHERRAYRESDLVTANYASVVQQFHAQHGRGAEFRLLPYSSETAFLRHGNEKSAEMPPELRALASIDAPLIVTVSRHDPRKGLDTFLRALAQVRDAGVAFRACLVSGGPLMDRHRQLAIKLKLDDRVVIPGWVDDSYQYLRHADIFVLPSTQEGSGSLSMIEALQAGATIIASEIDGIPEDLTHEENGLLVPAGEVDALARTIIRALTDADLRKRLGRRARETFRARFSPDAFARALGDTYQKLMD
jgi:glycosyltransferase involved in cell wall biosynthesis